MSRLRGFFLLFACLLAPLLALASVALVLCLHDVPPAISLLLSLPWYNEKAHALGFFVSFSPSPSFSFLYFYFFLSSRSVLLVETHTASSSPPPPTLSCFLFFLLAAFGLTITSIFFSPPSLPEISPPFFPSSSFPPPPFQNEKSEKQRNVCK